MAPDHAARWTAPPRGLVAPAIAALIIGAAVALALVDEALEELLDRMVNGDG